MRIYGNDDDTEDLNRFPKNVLVELDSIRSPPYLLVMVMVRSNRNILRFPEQLAR